MRTIRMVITVAVFAALFSTTGFSQWVQTGGPPGGGWVTSFAQIHDTLYAAEGNSGLWRSLDNGLSWRYLSALHLSSLFCLSVNRTNLIAGSDWSSALYMSTDPADTWSKMTDIPSNPTSVSALFSDSSGIYAATSSGLFRYADSSSTWTSLIGNEGILAVFDCNGIIFAGTTLHNVLYSTDHGSTWMESDSGLISNSVQLAFGSSSDSTIFAGTDLGLFTSSDTGKSWVQTDRKDVQGEVRAIAVNGECVVVGSDSGVFFSNDDGKTWEKRVHGLKSLFVSSLVWDNDILLCGTGAWIYSSADSGKDWTLADGGPDVSYINAIGTHNGVVFAAVRQGRTYLSTDNGGRWDQTKGIPDSASVTSFAKSPSHFYACTDHGLFKLNDTDTTWVNVDTTGVLTGSYSLTAWSDTTLFVESGGKLYRSKDGGSNWAESDSGLAGNLILASMAIDDTELFVGTSDGLYCSSDSGILWQELAVVDSSQQPAVGSIFIINRDTILLSGSNTFYSSDGGTTWACVSNYQLHNFVEAVNYILALRYGIETPYLSTDYGSNWRDISYNLSNGVDPTCLISASSYIFLGSRFSGVWRLPISYIDSVLSGIRGLKSPDRFQLGQNYPNPFNPTTTIQYEIPRQERVTLEIYDVLGQKVATLVDGMLQPGQYAAMWNGANNSGVRVATGVYFYRLQAGSFISVKKMLLLK